MHVVAAGGIYNGRTMAAALALGAEAVWVGTRFVASEEASTTKLHKMVTLWVLLTDLDLIAVITSSCRLW